MLCSIVFALEQKKCIHRYMYELLLEFVMRKELKKKFDNCIDKLRSYNVNVNWHSRAILYTKNYKI